MTTIIEERKGLMTANILQLVEKRRKVKTKQDAKTLKADKAGNTSGGRKLAQMRGTGNIRRKLDFLYMHKKVGEASGI